MLICNKFNTNVIRVFLGGGEQSHSMLYIFLMLQCRKHDGQTETDTEGKSDADIEGDREKGRVCGDLSLEREMDFLHGFDFI